MQTATLKTEWGTLVYRDSGNSGGSGTPRIFLHGTGCAAEDWAPVIAQLPAEHRCIAPDFRGHGASTVPMHPFTLTDLADDIGRLLDVLDLRHTTLIGHSLGGMVAMRIAERSDRVTSLLLLEGWTSLAAAQRAFTAGRFYGTLSETAITQIKQRSQATRHRFEPNIWHRFWESVQKFDARAYLKHAGIPIYEIYGSMGRNRLTAARLQIPENRNIRTVWVPGAGHYLPHERPEAVAARIKEHLTD